ncbi:MAG: hypothetical protein K6E17_01435 [Clostridiales bacterium]|nr:hypothetical protein [Clostridiales bacterium]
MKRLICLLTVLALAAVAFPACAEEGPDARAYDFSLRFHLNADVFPLRIRAHMQGYADLLEMLELRGNIVWSDDTQSFDLNASLIPVTNPDAAISFRLYGIPEHVCLSSPLLGSETLWFQNFVLMEFAYKTWNNLRIPLPWLVLLYPYVTENAFSRLREVWHRHTGELSAGSEISAGVLSAVADDWESILLEDNRLQYWFSAVGAPRGMDAALLSEFSALPSYLTGRVARRSIRLEGGQDESGAETLRWISDGEKVLYARTVSDGSDAWSVTLPETATGYVPLLSFVSAAGSETQSFRISGDYSRAEGTDSEDGRPDSFLRFSVSADSLPLSWPADAAFSAAASVSGAVLPNFDFTLRGTSGADGSLSFSLYQQVKENAEAAEVFSCSGSIVPVSDYTVPAFAVSDLTQHTHVFSISDTITDPVVRTIGRPLFMGLLNFLNELPARACQSVMDDLEDFGILEILVSTR